MTNVECVNENRQPDDRPVWGRIVGAGVWLVYLGGPLGTMLKGHIGAWDVIGIVATISFGVTYLWGLGTLRWVFPNYFRAWLYILALVGLAALTIPGAGDKSLTFVVFIAALSVAALKRVVAIAMVVILFVTAEAAGQVIDGWQTHGNGFAVLLASAAVFSFRLAFLRQEALRVAEGDLAELAVEEERSRIARDLHDILGHSLTVVSVKAELAGRLIDVDLDRARAELEDLQRLTRDALADVRATALGVRAISLPGEIASARSALESAGIDPRLPTVADEVPSRWRELFAWTIREGVTNVIRHSQATSCEISVDEHGVRVIDDGHGATEHSSDGHGLDGLRQRVALAGATLTTGPGPEGRGFALNVEVAS